MNDPNSSGTPEFLKDLEFINDQLSKTDLDPHQAKSLARSDGIKLADALADHVAEEETYLNQELEQACLDTGATGAAIALVKGEEIVCHATAGPHAPGIGVYLDPRTGLSGSCIQTRQRQQCDDTQTDPRVDAEACRRLGVRSVVALPLLDGDKLFGIFEMLSSRPNAFSQRDLDHLQALADRIVERRQRNRETKATGSRKDSGLFQHKLEEVVPRDKSRSSESDAQVPRLVHISRRNDIRTAMLGVLVIASAMLLGALVGWRLGWQRATALRVGASSPLYRVNPPSRNPQTDRTLLPVKQRQPSSAGMEECGPSAVADSSTQPQGGGLTVCEEGRVIFRLPPSAPLPIRNSRTSHPSPGLKANTARR